MSDDTNNAKGYAKLGKSTQDDCSEKIEVSYTAPVATTLLCSSSMLSQINVSPATETASISTEGGGSPRYRPGPTLQVLSEEDEEVASNPLLEEHSAAGTSASESGDSRTKPSSKAPIQESVTDLASNFSKFTNTNTIHTITGAATKIKQITHLGEAVNVIADFIPVVGNAGASIHYSRLRNSGRPTDNVNPDELARHHLHKSCALSVSALNSSSKVVGGGDVESIKQLVEKDPSQLQEQLPTSRDTPLHIAIRYGAMKWRQMLHYPGGTSNLEVIEYLIQAEIDLLRKEAVRGQRNQGTNNPISLESLVRQSALYKRDINDDLPIHTAAAEGFDGAVQILLKFDKDAGLGTVVEPGAGGNLLLHVAILRDDMELVKLFLAVDRKREEERDATTMPKRHTPKKQIVQTIFKPNKDGDLPLHLALPSHLKFELWDILLEQDTGKKTLYVKNNAGIDAFRFFVDQPHLCKGKDEFVDTHLAEAILKRLLSGKRLEPWDEHLKRSVASSQEMQRMMNNAAANRLPVMIFMFDFYAHVASILALYFGTSYYLENGKSNEAVWLSEVVVTMVVYFVGRNLVQLLLSKSLYWSDFWNYIDIVRIGLMVLLALVLGGEEGSASIWDDSDEEGRSHLRSFLLAVAVFMYLGLVSFLRITYLQFALFVGGMAEILITLIPFGVTFIMVLGLFAYGYWVGGYVSAYAEAEQPYGRWVLELFMHSMSGPEELITMEEAYINNTVWTFIFMVLVQILLLNVLIAVITSAWEDINEQQNEVFWKYRLEYAAGVLPIEHFLQKNFGNTRVYRCVRSIGDFIDSLEDKPLHDSVDWNINPYCRVLKDHSLYWDKDRFQMLMFEELKDRKDTNRTLCSGSEKNEVPTEEIDEAWRNMRSFEADARFSRRGLQRFSIRLSKVGFYFLWAGSFVAGFVTLGFFWPRVLRRFFCAPSTTKNAHEQPTKPSNEAAMFHATTPDVSFLEQSKPVVDSPTNDSRYQATEKKIDEMKATIDALQKTVEALVKLQTQSASERDQKMD